MHPAVPKGPGVLKQNTCSSTLGRYSYFNPHPVCASCGAGGVSYPVVSKSANTTGCLCKPDALKQQNPFKPA